MKVGGWIGKDFKLTEQRKQNIKKKSCSDLNQQICILSNGDYAICCFDCEGQVHLNIRNTPILSAFYSEVYEDLRKKLKENGVIGTICENCSFSYID